MLETRSSTVITLAGLSVLHIMTSIFNVYYFMFYSLQLTGWEVRGSACQLFRSNILIKDTLKHLIICMHFLCYTASMIHIFAKYAVELFTHSCLLTLQLLKVELILNCFGSRLRKTLLQTDSWIILTTRWRSCAHKVAEDKQHWRQTERIQWVCSCPQCFSETCSKWSSHTYRGARRLKPASSCWSLVFLLPHWWKSNLWALLEL